MGFAVITIRKAKGNDAGTSAHIERKVHPANADQSREHLNQKLIDYPYGVENRTQAIQHRIETAGIKRKISHNQVRALQVMLTGTPEDMQRIQAEGKLDEWRRDNIKWLRDTFGKDNVVAADLHMDEKTPHIHATVVPIVTGERRKAKQEQQKAGKIYKKKPVNATRLCADDVMTQENLERFQDTYAEKMHKYGLQRGIRGSVARHISTQQYYRDLYAKNEDLKEDIEYLEECKQEVNDKIRDLYDRKDEARDKFLNMHEYNKRKEYEISETESHLQQLKQEYEPYRAQEDINLLSAVFPKLGENLRIVQLCKSIGLTVEAIQRLFKGEVLPATGKLHSQEHDRGFSVQDAKLQLFKDRDNPDKLKLFINGQNIVEWFKEQYEKIKQATNHYTRLNIKPEVGKNKGFKR